MPIVPPEKEFKRTLARRLFDAFFSQIPLLGSPTVAIYSVTHQAHAEIVVEKWQREMTQTVNNQSDRISKIENAILDLVPTIKISDEAATIALILAKSCAYGHGFEQFAVSSLKEHLPDAQLDELIEVCGELAHLGLLKMELMGFGNQDYFVEPLFPLFEIFDSFAFEGRDVRADAAILAQHLISNEDLNSQAFINESGWDYRRFNPALCLVCQMIGEGRKSKTICQEFFTVDCFTIPEERAALKKFALNELRRIEGKAS